ncbi:methyl-accepting chemotaxis protein [Stieleria sp. JC731]|uniref:methyl-accepting chemotaxis protein n=1 Tax=Pirellulaceae TaxID=2691357 RepID=UPI001E2DEEA3|nr:methyl-accepting chemotaxis protein [Stieleria sp. JC731]MCC9600366.1 methyl-accepting chemotaxis protein [Stieleria sp. JC731]
MSEFFQSLSVQKRLSTIPVLFLIGLVGLVALMSWQSSNSAGSAAGINLAGRQRMLNQRFTREVLLAADGEEKFADFESTLKTMLESAELLMTGGPHEFGDIHAASDEALLGLLKVQVEAIARQGELANQFLDSVYNGLPDAESLKRRLVAQTQENHGACHRVVLKLDELASEDRASSVVIAWMVSLFVMVISVGWSLVCGRSVTRQVGKAAHEMRRLSEERLSTVSRKLLDQADKTSVEANGASTAAEQVSGNARALASAVEQFEQSIKEIAVNGSSAASVARQAVDATDAANSTISRLGESSTEIGNVINAINSIAEQTNLLALNATIEAARAGEAGKGFAVVANEVKELAKETSKSTEDIVRQVETIQADTDRAIKAIAQVSAIISQIDENQSAIAGAVEQQSAMTSEISTNINEVATGSSEIACSVGAVAKAADDTKVESNKTYSASSDIQAIALQLLELVGETSRARSATAERSHV